MPIRKKINGKTISLIKGDITDINVEAFVYDITEDAKLGTGYGSAIQARGGKTVQEELDAIGKCPKGNAIITSAGKMKAKHIIYVNGPKFHEPDQESKLRNAITAALKLAEKNSIAQLAFPPVGTGFYQVDLNMCTNVLYEEVRGHFTNGNTSLKEVVFVALDTREFKPFQNKIEQGG